VSLLFVQQGVVGWHLEVPSHCERHGLPARHLRRPGV
jgi:hypothetical protein